MEHNSVPDIFSAGADARTRCVARSGALRFPLVWPVYFWILNDAKPLIGKTLNISADSFYCIVPQPVRKGSRLSCHIAIPSRRDSIALHCDIVVANLDQSANVMKFGIECIIERYSVVRWNGFCQISP